MAGLSRLLHVNKVFTLFITTPRVKRKQDTLLLHIIVPNVNRFLKFFHQQTQQ